MLYKFKSQATADVIMLQGDAENILRIVGKEPSAQGIITAEQIPAAVSALQAAIAADEGTAAHGGQPHGKPPIDQDEAAQGSGVSLAQHASPFIDMLRRSAADGKAVVWGV